MANEADLKLIQIPEFPKTDTLVGSGSEYVVLTKADGVTYGMLTEDFKAFLGTVQVQVPKALAPTDPAPALSGVYYPTITQNEAGTPIVYTNAGGIEVNTAEGGADHNSMVQLIYDGSSWVKVNVPIEVPDTKIKDYKETESYEIGTQVSSAGDIYEAISHADPGVIPGQNEDVWKPVTYESLFSDGLNKVGSSEHVEFNEAGEVSSVIYKHLGITVRTDTYRYSGNTIVHTQTLANGLERVYATDLDTLVTFRPDTSYEDEDEISYPFSVISASNGWTFDYAIPENDYTITLAPPEDSVATMMLTKNSDLFKNSTRYGILLNVVSNTFTRSLILSRALTNANDVIVTTGVTGSVKKIIESRPYTELAYILFQSQGTETGQITISDLRMFELKEGSQIKYDFENLTAAELNIKYPKL